MRDLIAHLEKKQELAPSQVERAVALLLSREESDAGKAEFLIALRDKGETAGEIAAFVKSLLGSALDPQIDPAEFAGPIIDVCGTGGDKLDLFNVSTTGMFILAAGGVIVAKHGNRGVTSRSGGADVLERLGVRIDLEPADLRRCLRDVGAGFMFAQKYHPAFAVIGPVRKALAARGIPTVFNKLGPLLNPARPPFQLVGVFAESLMKPYSEVLGLLGRQHVWVVHGRTGGGEGMDEISTMGATQVLDVRERQVAELTLTPEALGVSVAHVGDLRGGDAEENARILTAILDGSERGPKRDLALASAAGGFVVAGLAPEIGVGMELARAQIDSGRAVAKLRELQQFA